MSDDRLDDDSDFSSDERDEYGDSSPAETLPCPECGALVYEESQQCPACGQYITFAAHAWQGRPWWWILLGLLGCGATAYLFLLF